ncbi:hypothetical protein ACS0TY_009306 [Phlomoides rotata]
MFYSQFILAKKGPLGTVWIAAHLERKLRKNQVADTDIGTSVDSILSPDVPIALRMSSHLLLGVVRIYSRKVNYLFDDCSETLLNVKQAFRSSAVDLPPEESKAPYHSITLPETFDLDDFELPDNDIFQGNFVDHHISSREQITLQDSMDGVAYSTSKFGLDERFGDGDASGLNLDEELFLDKIGTAGHAIERSDPQSSVGPMTPLKQDEHPETMVDGVDDYADLMDYEHAPCTPGLEEESNLSNVKEVLACDDRLESEYHSGGSSMTENVKNNVYGDKQDVDWSSCDNKTSEATPTVLTEEYGHQSDGLHSNLSKPPGDIPIGPNTEHVQLESSSGSQPLPDLLGQEKTLNPAPDVSCLRDFQNEAPPKNDNSSLPIDNPTDHHQSRYETGLEKSACEISGVTIPCHQVSEGFLRKDEGSVGVEVPGIVEIASELEIPLPNAFDLPSENQDGSFLQNPETQALHKAADPSSLNLDVLENDASSGTLFLRPCNSKLEPPGITSGSIMSTDAALQSDVTAFTASEREETVMIGKGGSGTDHFEEMSKENHMQEQSLQVICAPDSQVINAGAHDKLMENLSCSSEADLPAPEKLLSVPEDCVDPHNRMLPEASPGVFTGLDEGDAGRKIVPGKKRSITESTLTEQSLNSVESSRQVRFKRTIDSVPADDDLLSSILVGRSSVLKVKATPRLSEATSTKRTRSGLRTGGSKRKLLMDNTMVLHGDMIRQQLTNTGDIRRVRKKAPCTRAEISMIQKRYLDDDNIFLEPLFTGMSVELISLHNQKCDLRGITVCKNDLTGTSPEIDDDLRQPSENLPSRNGNDVSFETMAEPILNSNDVQDGGTLRSSNETHLTSQTFEYVENLDTGSDKNFENPNVVEQSEMRITSPPLLDRDGDMAKSSESLLLSNNRMNVEIDTCEEHTTRNSDAEGDRSEQELLLDVTGVETCDKNNDASSPSTTVVQLNHITETSETNTSVFSDTLSCLPDQGKNAPSVELDYAVIDGDDGQAISRDELMANNGDINALFETEPLVRDDVLSERAQDNDSFDLPSNSKPAELGYDEHIHSDMLGENLLGSAYPVQVGLQGDGFMDNGGSPGQGEAYQRYMMEADGSYFDLHGQEEPEYTAAGNDTEFLNVDDDELTDDDHIPDDEEARFAENTGWSSRTRAVSKYLQTMFVKEADFGRKSLSMDSLLNGKSRKEASRMFFEALVLKTRDYIHVEQQNPFDNITIKPRTRLMKSDF